MPCRMAGQNRFIGDNVAAEIDVPSVTPPSIKLNCQGGPTMKNRNSVVRVDSRSTRRLAMLNTLSTTMSFAPAQ
jgi:hypothetical protein